MKIFFILNLFSLFEILSPQFLTGMSQEYQKEEMDIDLQKLLIDDKGIFLGLWSRYSPLGITKQIGIVGLMDSNCFHYQSIIGKSSRSLELIYYDCLNIESQTVSKFVIFNTIEGHQHIYQIDIDPFEYEGVWYLFELLYYPQKSLSEFLIVKENEILIKKKVETILFQENSLKLTIGNSLVVQNSNLKSLEVGSKFSYFPGKMYMINYIPKKLSGNKLEIESYVMFFEEVSKIFSEDFITTKISDQDLFWLDVQSIIPENSNADSFILAGWFRIIKINQVDDEFTYQFLKMCKNTKQEQLQNPNLSPFQLFYKISPNNNKIIITTYSYNYPSVSLDFTNKDNNFILTKEFELNHKITLWHHLIVNLIQDQISIQINFFDSKDVFQYSSTHIVRQFSFVQFLIQYGNLMKSYKNYLDIQTRNNYFNNFQQSIKEPNCQFTCQDCDGPTNTDCLSCSESSNRIYVSEHKACICPYNYLDDQINQNCLSYNNLSLTLKDQYNEDQCKFGYFEYDDSCYLCPTIISDKFTTCLECVSNVKGWKDNAYCQTMIYLNPNGNTVRKIVSFDAEYFLFDGQGPIKCNSCLKQQFSKIDSIYQLFYQVEQRFKTFCQYQSYIYYESFKINYCYECQIDYCQLCQIEITGIKCIRCLGTYQLINGICTPELSGPSYLTSCRTPYYQSSIKKCKLCPIKYCIYCFEYQQDDLEKCTLYADFDIFELDDQTRIGCALCEENFTYDFTIGECIFKQPSQPNCLRSFINSYNQEICTLSSTDFNIALEIVNCGKLIENCLQCILTPWYELKCIICKIGFTTSVRRGNCYAYSSENAIIVIDGDNYEYDSWIQRVQSFLMKFLPNQYFYQRKYISYDNQGNNIINQIYYSIECQEGYSQNYLFKCRAYCSQECLNCKEDQREYEFYCTQCPLNYYYQPIRSLANRQCIRCPELCEVCEERSEAEIQKLNPYFQITAENRMYSYKCIKAISNKNVQIDSYLQIAKFCFTPQCDLEFIYNYTILIPEHRKQYILYCNQIGLKVLKIQYNLYNPYQQVFHQNSLKEQIFGLQLMKFEQNLFYNGVAFREIIGFDFIEINDAYLFENTKQYIFSNDGKKVDLILNNIVVEKKQINNIPSLFNLELFGDITFNNITLIDNNFSSLSLFNFNQKLQQGTIKISKVIFQNCHILNSQLFSFFNNQVQIQIEQLIINQSFFSNSSFITFAKNNNSVSKLEVKGITITSSHFHRSYIFYCSNLEDIIINNVIFDNNTIILSTIFAFNKNFTLFNAQVISNHFFESQFIATLETENKTKIFCFVDNQLVSQNDFTISNLFLISNQNMYYNLRTVRIQFNQGYSNQYKENILFNIHCYKLEIENIYIVDSNKIGIFYFFEVFEIFASNIVYENLKINNKVPSDINCMDFHNFNYQLLLISGYSIVKLKNIKAIKLFSIDTQLIEISSMKEKWINQISIIELINLEFIGNLLLHSSQGSYFSLMAINSEYDANIQFQNILLEKNFIHQQTDDPQDSRAVLIHVDEQWGHKNQQFLMFIQCPDQFFKFIHIVKIQDHHINKLYCFTSKQNNQLGDEQQQTNLIILQRFKMLNKCGAGLITSSIFSCFNCYFQDVIGLKSSIFEIKTQGEGIIYFKNLTINSSEYDISEIIDSTGCIAIYSSNSLLDLKIINAVFTNIFNRMTASILTISSSFKKNQILIQDALIKNCISLMNPILQILFSTQNIGGNKVVIKNVTINFQESAWIQYFSKTGMLNNNEILDVTTSSNALIQLQNCIVVMSKILFQGLFSCPLIKLKNIQYLLISQLWAIEIKVLYNMNLLELSQDLSIKSTINIKYANFQSIQIYEVINNPIYQSSKRNYMSSGCLFIEKQQQQVTYSFGKIIQLFQQFQKASAIILLQSNSNNTAFYIQNVILNSINCSYCKNGLIFFNIENYKILNIRDLISHSNHIKEKGCINIASIDQINHSSLIKNSNFFNNYGGSGIAIHLSKIPITIIQCIIINNIASNQGGALFLDMDMQYLIIKKSSIINNYASEGGGIYLFQKGNINLQNMIQTFIQFNKADLFSDNLFEFPTHLSLFINQKEMQAQELQINIGKIRVLKLKPYKTIEQGVIKFSQDLMIPSQQIIKKYKSYVPQLQTVQILYNDPQLMLKNSRNELQKNSHQFSCQVSQATTRMNQANLYEKNTLIDILQTDGFNHFDLGSLQFHYDPYQDENHKLEILVNCTSNISERQLLYQINARTYKCQLGEFYIDEGCQICESTFGFYSVTYDVTKCSIFDKTKFAKITSNAINLLEGYWRPNIYSDYIDYCFKNILFCKGGWGVGDELCSLGHLGGLCEECDLHNKKGEGNFFKNQQDSTCKNCSLNSITPLILSFIWALVSIVITLRSIEKSNLLFSKLQFKLRFRKILFKLEKDMEGIFIKMLFIYLWIFSVIFTFNIRFSISFQFIDQASNTSLFMASSLDCYISEVNQIEIIYGRIFVTIFLILIQFAIILIGYQIYILIYKGRFQNYIVSNTLLYLYVSNFSGLIKSFCSIVSKRIISNIEYIQGDLTLIYGSLNHIQWIYKFALPGLAVLGFCIPFSLFWFMFLTKKRFNKIQFRRHICYLFDEYNEQNYFWEQIKFSKKIIIILVMTYFESNILLKATLLGLFLLIYQIIAGSQQPYNLKKLNNLDIQAVQICSVAIFVAIAKYVNDQQIENAYSQIMQIIIMLLCVKLCYQFILDIFRAFIKKYRVYFVTILYHFIKSIKPNSKNSVYLDNLLIKLNMKEKRVQSNFQTLKKQILKILKAQRKIQNSFFSVSSNNNFASLIRYKQLHPNKNKILLTLKS
ncbi:unnamed protein product [Paramecium sonneborni]|uniref:Transmembrane protein n=1 Tax=Paramecium sonneborni TaxID=65129 RepID=A0A8S1RMH2_9CILI|nr:unnamed protein product [Paramecium sonneborni]